MLIGGKEITQEYDVEHFFDRFKTRESAIELKHPSDKKYSIIGTESTVDLFKLMI
ncbi:hypothetical protein [methane-oxidizing endosymbiont of Gigantopelta aegis]|uniref:hypothetical protein n=1 Tax=methane-oxidizing endosymbiont of Gigantopelta aegis TaxID=2794938 RepID=UPI001BE4ABAE|nr:hypothetical protein [methane-oxidizing endosymbiont of Gigantopelta aegis]